MWELADQRAATKPIYNFSHRGRAANQLGCLGEIAAEWWMQREAITFLDETFHTTHDYRLANEKTVDVKTKDRTVPPRPSYDCSVPTYNHEHQLPDYYLFVSLQRDRSYGRAEDIRRYVYAYVLGAVNQLQLRHKGRLMATNEVDLSNGTRFWTECINIRINQLEPITEVAEVWRRAAISKPKTLA